MSSRTARSGASGRCSAGALRIPGAGRIFVDTVLGWYARKFRERGVASGESGAFTVVQRVSSDLRLNLDPLPSLSSGEVADLMQTVRVRVVGWLDRHGVIDASAELSALDDDFAEREPALAALARASVSGLAPAGPERRERAPLSLAGALGVEVKAPLSVAELGFSLHAATVVGALDIRHVASSHRSRRRTGASSRVAVGASALLSHAHLPTLSPTSRALFTRCSTVAALVHARNPTPKVRRAAPPLSSKLRAQWTYKASSMSGTSPRWCGNSH